MSGLDRELLAEKAAAIERHLARVAERLPADPEELQPATDASDAVILHLWQAVQLAIDLALAACLHLKLPAPATYADAFRALAAEEVLDEQLADRLTRAAGFRNLVVHAYGKLDLKRIHQAATAGPRDLEALVAALAKLV